MSLSYDEEIFERARWGFEMSQRFRRICHRFRGTLKLVFEMASAKVVLSTLPRTFAYIFFFTFILFLLFLCILIYVGRRNKDPDLLEAIKSSRKVIKNIGSLGALILIILIYILGSLMFVLVEKVSFGDAEAYAFLLFIYLLVLVLVLK